jgi:hypothetical protein
MTTLLASGKLGTVGFARNLFTRGTNFFSYEEISKAFGADAIPCIGQDPPLPTEEEMSRARELGQRLILCGPTPMVQMHDLLDNELGGGKLLYNMDWYRNEDF